MEKFRLSIVFFFIALCFSVKGQNLVPNYSFEDTLQCIQGFNQVQGYVANWGGGAAGLSYFTSLCNESEDSVPINWYGYRPAHTGHAYVGIYTFDSDSCNICPSINKNYRNYLQNKLIDSLKFSTTYYVTFYVCNADSSWYYCNTIGAYFSDSALYYPSPYTHVKAYLIPQIENDPVKNPLTSTKNWMKVSGSFVAKGNEKYIIIGNFKNDSLSSIIYKGHLSAQEPDAFYYIDDVIVSTDSNYADSLMGVQPINEQSKDYKVYPNPASTLLNVEINLPPGQTGIICMYNDVGQKVECLDLQNGITTLGINTLTSGIYYYRITDVIGKLIKADKLMIIH